MATICNGLYVCARKQILNLCVHALNTFTLNHPYMNTYLFDPSIFEVHRFKAVLVNRPEADLLDQIHWSKDLDEPVVKALWELDAGNIWADEWEWEGNIILHQGWVYVPQDAQLRADIPQAHHDSPTVGHPGCWKTLELVSHNYCQWPGLTRYTTHYGHGHCMPPVSRGWPSIGA